MSHSNQINEDFYVVGGTMLPDSPSYIEREADQELYKHIKVGDFCYIFTSRQMGKSSLMARTAKRLRGEGTYTVILDLTMIGAEKAKKSSDSWYYGIAHQILKQLGLKPDLHDWWKSRGNLSSLQRLTEFLKDMVLGNIPGKVVIFVDEIDTTISLPFTDDFFAAIRACYNFRATDPEYSRLSFVLLGVASPSQLIKDTRRTPFNIGYRINLTDFTFEEARPLARYLCLDKSTREKALKRILYWTGGHPYLTQKLCRALNTERIKACTDEDVDHLVKKQFLTPEAETQDHNLNFVRDRLTCASECSSRDLLKIYKGIYKGETVMDDPLSPVHTALKLSSVIVPRDGRRLSVRNRIYEQVFTPGWVKDAMPANWTLWVGAVAFMIILLGFGSWYLILQPRPYISTLRIALEDFQVAYDAYQRLHRIPGYTGKADSLLSEYWDRRALYAEAAENRDGAILFRLKALTVQGTNRRRKEIAQFIGADYQRICATYRHTGTVSAVAFSPDGRRVVTGSGDNTARLWDAETGKPISEPMRHEAKVYAVAFSPDGKAMMTATRFWLHLYSVSEDILKPKATRLLDYPLADNAPNAYHFKGPSGNHIQIVIKVTGNSVRIEEVRFDIPNAPAIQGDPNILLDEWQKKLALQLNQEGKIVPMWASGQPFQKEERNIPKSR
jgi:hypothetical protein